MKQICVLLLLVCTVSAWAPPYGYIHFRHGDLKESIKLAKEENKLIFVDLTAHWCHACRLMEETTFRAPDIVSLVNDNYIAVKLDADQIDGKLLAAQENVKILPALMVMNEKGEKLDMINHAPSHEQLAIMLKSNLPGKLRQQRSR